jgi:hypothetical protein
MQRIIRVNCHDKRQDTLAALPFTVEIQMDDHRWEIWPDISPDHSFIICGQVEIKRDVWLLENFDPHLE